MVLGDENEPLWTPTKKPVFGTFISSFSMSKQPEKPCGVNLFVFLGHPIDRCIGQEGTTYYIKYFRQTLGVSPGQTFDWKFLKIGSVIV